MEEAEYFNFDAESVEKKERKREDLQSTLFHPF